MLLFSLKKMIRYWNYRGQGLILPMHTVLVLKSWVEFQLKSLAEVRKLALEKSIAKDQDPILHLQHTLEILLCHQWSWAQSCRTRISFPCKDPQLNELFYCFYTKLHTEKCFGQASLYVWAGKSCHVLGFTAQLQGRQVHTAELLPAVLRSPWENWDAGFQY